MDYRDYILLSILWMSYCALHSALISTTFTEFVKRTMGERSRYHRIFFNLFSLASIVPLLIYSNSPRWGSDPLFAWEGSMRIIQYALIGLAAILIMGALSHYSMSRLLGIEQIRGKSGKGISESGELDSSGVLGVVRHPFYAAVFILLWTGDLTLSTIIINVILSAYLVIGTLLEERKLVLEFGDRYRQYQGKVSMFIPVKWLKAKLPRGCNFSEAKPSLKINKLPMSQPPVKERRNENG
jgi:protein-S-isoprenylcysteine O-methyltransferase Ste14